ncbi:hypothetical protein [Burkholderia cepacia]|uniref:hypothetical protein n=1 Tax=Burkholderia cepacia TaxID=292 RepID=UPI00298FA99B|nr:hypothetical protein [Burkholderia cepacia]
MSASHKALVCLVAFVMVAIGAAAIGGLMYLGAPAPRGLDPPELTVTILAVLIVAKILIGWGRMVDRDGQVRLRRAACAALR